MKVLVQLLGKITKQAKVSEFWIYSNEDMTLGDLLKRLADQENVQIKADSLDTLILVNGLPVRSLDYKLKDMDRVIFLPLVFGG